jgi:shikimate kinase
MGSGKSTTGPVLANRLGYAYVDTDVLIERISGATVSQIFMESGEEAFRRIETHALENALFEDDIVLSCGGGVVLKDENRALLKDHAVVIYLKITADEVFARVGRTGHQRPLLDAEDPLAEIERLLEAREPLYMELADIVIDTAGKSEAAIVEEIIEELHGKEIEL